MVKIALLLWLIGMVISFLAKAEGRKWMPRLFLAGFCLVLVAVFLKLIRL